MKYSRFLPIIIPITTFLLLEMMHYKPEFIYISGSFLILLHFIAARQLLLSAKTKETWRNIVILPTVSTLAVIAFSLFLPKSLNHLLYLAAAVLIYFYYRILYYYLINPDKYTENSLENLSSYSNLISFYFIASSVYGLQVLLNAEVWILILIILAFSALIIYEGFWANGLKNPLNYIYIGILCLVLVEIAWTISFLPLSYLVLGLVLTVCYYVVFGLTKHYLLGILNKRLVKLYLIFGLSSILTVLLTARWL